MKNGRGGPGRQIDFGRRSSPNPTVLDHNINQMDWTGFRSSHVWRASLHPAVHKCSRLPGNERVDYARILVWLRLLFFAWSFLHIDILSSPKSIRQWHPDMYAYELQSIYFQKVTDQSDLPKASPIAALINASTFLCTQFLLRTPVLRTHAYFNNMTWIVVLSK